MGRLSENQVFTLKLKELESNFDEYKNNSTGETMHCHRFLMTDGTDDFPCQWCNEFPKVTDYKLGDIIKIQIKSYKKNIHNMVPLSKVESSKPNPSERVYEPIKEGPKQGTPVVVSTNPNIAGTMIDRAMTNAVTYWKGNEVPFGSVTDIADEILEWYKKQFNSINNAG